MTRPRMTCAVIAVVLAGLPAYTALAAQPSEQTTSRLKVRVGTFDSRCLAMAYYASDMFKSHMRKLKAEYEKAKAAGDKKRVEELEARSASGIWPDTGWPQHAAQGEMIHKQGFSTWPVDNILERIRGKIPEIAKQADVDIIISKWDIPYQRPEVELVDVTPLLVNLIVEDETARKNALKIRAMRPIPRETLIDPND
ncbi:MAG: hypothetical protein H8E66_03985 [Planctomycetes bacterium]|nr:hypothetical protein [Planctomycetota bacterium]